MLVYPSAIDLSSRTLRHLSGLLAGHRRRRGMSVSRFVCRPGKGLYGSREGQVLGLG